MFPMRAVSRYGTSSGSVIANSPAGSWRTERARHSRRTRTTQVPQGASRPRSAASPGSQACQGLSGFLNPSSEHYPNGRTNSFIPRICATAISSYTNNIFCNGLANIYRHPIVFKLRNLPNQIFENYLPINCIYYYRNYLTISHK